VCSFGAKIVFGKKIRTPWECYGKNGAGTWGGGGEWSKEFLIRRRLTRTGVKYSDEEKPTGRIYVQN